MGVEFLLLFKTQSLKHVFIPCLIY